MRIALFSAIPRGFISRCSKVQLGMAALRLYDLRAFSELSCRAAHEILLFPFPGRWLIPSIAVVVGHATSSMVAIHELCRGRGFQGPAIAALRIAEARTRERGARCRKEAPKESQSG
jgi:hypothetical protein